MFGASIAVIRPPGATARSFIQHFAAGVVFALVAVELVPRVMQVREPIQVAIGFVLGVIAMLLIRNWSQGMASGAAGRSMTKSVNMGLLAAIAVDIFVDGLLL